MLRRLTELPSYIPGDPVTFTGDREHIILWKIARLRLGRPAAFPSGDLPHSLIDNWEGPDVVFHVIRNDMNTPIIIVKRRI